MVSVRYVPQRQQNVPHTNSRVPRCGNGNVLSSDSI